MYGQWCELTLYKQHKRSSQRAGACVYVYSYYVCACFLWVIHHLLYLQYKAILQVNIQRDYSPQKHHNRTVVVTHSVACTHAHTHTHCYGRPPAPKVQNAVYTHCCVCCWDLILTRNMRQLQKTKQKHIRLFCRMCRKAEL